MRQVLTLFILAAFSSLAFAQQPDLRLKAFMGANIGGFIEKSDTISSEILVGVQGGFGFRILKKRLMCEIDFNFLRYALFGTDSLQATIQINSFELPVNLGYATYKTPLIKHFLYGGITTNFIVKGFYDFADASIPSVKWRPRNTNLSNPTFLMRLGTQLDIAFFNLDFNYSLGLNKTYRQNIRTQSHMVQVNFGLIF